MAPGRAKAPWGGGRPCVTSDRIANPIATVLPEPVCDVMRRSRPSSEGSSTAAWTEVSVSKPLLSRACVRSGPRDGEKAEMRVTRVGSSVKREGPLEAALCASSRSRPQPQLALREGDLDPLLAERGVDRVAQGARDLQIVAGMLEPAEQVEAQPGLAEVLEAD